VVGGGESNGLPSSPLTTAYWELEGLPDGKPFKNVSPAWKGNKTQTGGKPIGKRIRAQAKVRSCKAKLRETGHNWGE